MVKTHNRKKTNLGSSKKPPFPSKGASQNWWPEEVPFLCLNWCLGLSQESHWWSIARVSSSVLSMLDLAAWRKDHPLYVLYWQNEGLVEIRSGLALSSFLFLYLGSQKYVSEGLKAGHMSWTCRTCGTCAGQAPLFKPFRAPACLGHRAQEQEAVSQAGSPFSLA